MPGGHRSWYASNTMGLVSKEDVPIEAARIDQAAVMNENTVLLSFTNGSSVLVDSEELKKLALSSGRRIVDEADVDAEEAGN